MKKLILGALAVATLGAAALPASAQVVVRERPNGTVVVRPAYSEPAYRYRDDRGYGYGYRHNHHRRVVWFDRWGHRHVEWR